MTPHNKRWKAGDRLGRAMKEIARVSQFVLIASETRKPYLQLILSLIV